MNEDTIQILQNTFAEFVRSKEQGAVLFYERLFVLDPSLRRLFTGTEMESQHSKLMTSLGLVIGALRDLSGVKPVLEDLARRHVGYGVKDAHYATVGQALIQTLSLTFGSQFTTEIRAAWLSAYALVSTTMINAANEHTRTLATG